ncbi:myb-like protein V [Drosophila takahashii]|uniref:myb-like protein V n=1 Tax=Drosophila takahashii TaxID=29030 RepID=UPI003898FF5B
MGARSVATWTWRIQLLILLSGVILSIQAAPAEIAEDVTHPPPTSADQLQTESRSRKDDVLDVDEDLDGRNAYINNQFVPSEPAEVLEDEQNAPLYEILQKQMEQVLASSAPNDPVYEQREKQERREQLPHQPPYFSGLERDADSQDDYEDEEDPSDQGYAVDPEKPDAVQGSPEEEDHNEAGYQAPSLSLPSSTTRRPHRRRSTTTTSQPRTTRTRTSAHPRTTARPLNQTSTTEQPLGSTTSHRPKISSTPHPGNNLPSDPQVYQHKRRIVFKTISTGSQFVNSPIGDLMIKFSIGFAKPAAPGGAISTSGSPSSSNNEALRALSQNLIRNLELQKLKRANKVQRD